jgi:hypothetical protein
MQSYILKPFSIRIHKGVSITPLSNFMSLCNNFSAWNMVPLQIFRVCMLICIYINCIFIDHMTEFLLWWNDSALVRSEIARTAETRIYRWSESFHNINERSRGKFVSLFFFRFKMTGPLLVVSARRHALPHQETELIREVINIHMCAVHLFLKLWRTWLARRA